MTQSALSTFRFHGGACIAQTQPMLYDTVTLDSPALQVMTDLTEVRAATTQPQISLAQAKTKMIYQGVRLLFVVSEMPCVDGIVTAADLEGERPMRLVHQRQVRHDELCVADVMTPLADLDAFEFSTLQRATVAQVVDTFKQFGKLHLLVIETASPTARIRGIISQTRKSGFALAISLNPTARIRGIISQTQVQRQLGTPLHATEIASTFSEIEKALA